MKTKLAHGKNVRNPRLEFQLYEQREIDKINFTVVLICSWSLFPKSDGWILAIPSHIQQQYFSIRLCQKWFQFYSEKNGYLSCLSFKIIIFSNCAYYTFAIATKKVCELFYLPFPLTYISNRHCANCFICLNEMEISVVINACSLAMVKLLSFTRPYLL